MTCDRERRSFPLSVAVPPLSNACLYPPTSDPPNPVEWASLLPPGGRLFSFYEKKGASRGAGRVRVQERSEGLRPANFVRSELLGNARGKRRWGPKDHVVDPARVAAAGATSCLPVSMSRTMTALSVVPMRASGRRG